MLQMQNFKSPEITESYSESESQGHQRDLQKNLTISPLN